MFDRTRLKTKPLRMRKNRVRIGETAINPDAPAAPLPDRGAEDGVRQLADGIRAARNNGAPRILAFGAHAIKNGLGPLLIRLIEEAWISALATNGAGIIHDWELAYIGETSEDVRTNIALGEFGLWEETGKYLNLALNLGAWKGLGYGESVGAMTAQNGLDIPSECELLSAIEENLVSAPEKSAAACDLLEVVRQFELEPGKLHIKHRHVDHGVQAAAFRLGIAYTGHPMFGHDIIYTHPMSRGSAIGRTAERDFLQFAAAIAEIESGVYLSVGSAVMSPMIFEKSFSMATNIAVQDGKLIRDHRIFVVDLTPSSWNWQRDGEPPADDAAYYLRFLKTFSRMGGHMQYVPGDNRLILPRLYHLLKREER